MQARHRFIGIRPFEESEKDIFFERWEYIDQLTNAIKSTTLTLVHSQAGIGKTSIIKSGVLPNLHKNQNAKVIYLSFANFIKNAGINPLSQIYAELDELMPKYSYLDKVIEPENSLWYKLKRIENASDEPFYLILDQFENVFTHEQTYTYQLRNELYSALYEPFPRNLKRSIEQKLQNDENILTEKGFQSIFSRIKINVLVSIRSDKLDKINFFAGKLPLYENIIEVKPLSKENARNILLKTTSYLPKYNIDNIFASKPFTIDDNLLNKILHFLTKDSNSSVETYQIQIIGKELEKLSVENNLEVVGSQNVNRIEDIYEDYYESIVKNIEDSQQQAAAKKFIEDELIFEYEHRKLTVYQGVATKKYELFASTLHFLVNNLLITEIVEKDGSVYYELSHDALITPILIAKEKRIKYEIKIQKELEQKAELESKASIQAEKTRIAKRFSIIFAALFAVALILAIIAKKQSVIANRNKNLAQSSLFASHSLYLIEKDATESFRLAQKSYEISPTNYLSVSALLNSFYKAVFFYNIADSMPVTFDAAALNNTFDKVLMVHNQQKDKSVEVFNLKTKKYKKFVLNKLISSASFMTDNKLLVSSFMDGMAYIYDTNANVLQTFNHNSFVNFSKSSQDNKYVVTCGNDNIAKVWQKDGKLITTLKHNAVINYASFSTDDNYIVTASDDNKIQVWDLKGKKISEYQYELEFRNQWVTISVADFSTSLKYAFFVVNSYTANSYQVKVWDWHSNEIVSEFKNIDSWINGASFIDSTKIAAYTKSGNAYLLNVKTNKIIKLSGAKDEIFNAQYNNSNNLLYTISKDLTLRTWKIYDPSSIFEQFQETSNIKYSNTGNLIALYDNGLKVIDLLGKIHYTGSNQMYVSIDFSTDDSYVISHNDELIKWSNIVTKAETVVKVYDSIVYTTIAGDNSKIFVVTTYSALNYSFTGQKTKLFIFKQKAKAAALIYSKLFIATDKHVLVYSNSGEILDSLNIKGVKSIKTNRGEDYKVIFVTNNEVYLADKDLKKIQKIQLNKKITVAQLSSNATYISVGIQNECILYNSDCKQIINFQNSGQVIDISFAPNEKSMLVVSQMPDMQTNIVSYLISPQEIIKYVDQLNLYGQVQKFSEQHFKDIIESF